MDETINSTAYNLVILSNLLLEWSKHPIFVAQNKATNNLAPVQNLKWIQARHNASSEVRSADALVRRYWYYTRTLCKVVDEADIVLFVPDAHDTNRDRGKLEEEQVRGGGQAARATRLGFTEGPPPHGPLTPFPPVGPDQPLLWYMSFAFARCQSLAGHGAPLLGIVGLPNVSKAA
ncbi:hypothetical protein EDB86DRAFT_2825073 [Lactarius hatsudake]|nr:hypothetical protein EDB86DRAFT_2825073 [Lactarius hatsudake]